MRLRSVLESIGKTRKVGKRAREKHTYKYRRAKAFQCQKSAIVVSVVSEDRIGVLSICEGGWKLIDRTRRVAANRKQLTGAELHYLALIHYYHYYYYYYYYNSIKST